MSAASSFYLARAAESAKEASEAKLDNVRERCLRAEAAWRAMADRILISEARAAERQKPEPEVAQVVDDAA